MKDDTNTAAQATTGWEEWDKLEIAVAEAKCALAKVDERLLAYQRRMTDDALQEYKDVFNKLNCNPARPFITD